VKPNLPSAAAYPVIEATSECGGILGAVDTMCQFGTIQEESRCYSVFDHGRKKHDSSLPLIGVNTLLPKEHAGESATTIELIRSTEEEKSQQITNLEAFRANRNSFAPESSKNLQQAARERRNVFAQLMEAVKFNSEGQISHALYDVGGEYRRNM
jgi:methylmalonyl-CoA mutase